jgi:hypothetical protein
MGGNAMTSRHGKALNEAQESLQPFYDPGDDGYPVTLALDAIAAVLGKKAGIEVPEEDGLLEVLAQIVARAELQAGIRDLPFEIKDLRAGIEELYAAARGAEYGGGLTKKGARTVNNHVQDYAEAALELARTYRRPRKRGRG